MVCLVGCSRSQFRRQADDEVSAVLTEKGWHFGADPVYRGPDSRLHDPSDPDRPSLPPDDPASHQFMQVVDGKAGYQHWYRNGQLPKVDAGTWREFLPRDESNTVVLDYRGAIHVATTNSREYQRELEDLYLSALDVTFERFQFDTQLFSGSRTTFTADGPTRGGGGGRPATSLETISDGELRRLTATGGEIVVGLANTIVWQFAGPDTNSVRSLLDFSIVQPLLRFGGRARVLENLTLVERRLLANVRQMEQFRQGFFVDIATGRNSGEGPSPTGDVGQSGLGLLAGTPSGRTGAPNANGFLGLLQEQQQIRNQTVNVSALRDSLAQLEASFDAGRIRIRLQVDQTRQALYNAQSSLLSAKAAYKTRLDQYKVQLGLPPDVHVRIKDSLIDRFNLLDPSMTEIQDEVSAILDVIRVKSRITKVDDLKTALSQLKLIRQNVVGQRKVTQAGLEELDANLPSRAQHLRRLHSKTYLQQANVDPRIYDENTLAQRAERLKQRLPKSEKSFATIWDAIDKLEQSLPETELEDARNKLVTVTTELSGVLLGLALDQASARLEGIALRPNEIDSEEAFEVAKANRLDLMNARARLVDSWRRIEFDANALKSDLSVTFSGDMSTVDDNPVKFDPDTGRLQAGLAFDTPTTRLAERNQYRATLIEYQRARREFMLFEDEINQSVRNSIRMADLLELNFEIRRAAVNVAIAQVDVTRLELTKPPKPGEVKLLGATTARDLVSALNDLLDAQNDFLNVWVSYEVLRILIDFELGTMQLNEHGVWIDQASGEEHGSTNDALNDQLERLPTVPGREDRD